MRNSRLRKKKETKVREMMRKEKIRKKVRRWKMMMRR